MERIVIVGGGLSGFETARALRGQGFAGQLVMLAAEPEPPYDRPPLSKDFLAWRDVSLHFDVSAVPDVDLRLDTAAVGIEPGCVLTEGERVAADGIVLAVGADPIALDRKSVV